MIHNNNKKCYMVTIILKGGTQYSRFVNEREFNNIISNIKNKNVTFTFGHYGNVNVADIIFITLHLDVNGLL